MKILAYRLGTALGAVLVSSWATLSPTMSEPKIVFDDVTHLSGLDGLLDCMMGHTAAVGDVDNDGFPDLMFGSFADRRSEVYACDGGAGPDRVLKNNGDGTWRFLPPGPVEEFGRSSGAVFADLDGDGDLDLVVARNSQDNGSQRKTRANGLYRNDDGSFVDVTTASGLAVNGMRSRNVLPLDFDGDGLLDLFIVDDLLGWVGSKLFRNAGNLRFTDGSADAGLPTDLGGLGAAVGDVNNDGWPDIFVAHEDRLFVNDGDGQFVEAIHLKNVFRWPGQAGSEDWRAGAAFGDVNRDGLLDLVVGHHYDSASRFPRSVRLYLNRSTSDGVAFEDVTEQSGLAPIASKSPHVEIQDMDNDGWPDIVVSVLAYRKGAVTPLVFRHNGHGDDVPTFSTLPFTVAAENGGQGLGYWPAAPTFDFDRDGRLDILGVEWEASLDSPLYRNVSTGGHYLEVAVRSAQSSNSLGIGSRVEIFEPGYLGDRDALVGRGEIATGYGYSSGQEAVVHFGLADRDRVDLRVTLPHGGPVIEQVATEADQRLTLTTP